MTRYLVELTDRERAELKKTVTTGKAGAARIMHANILLAVDRSEEALLRMTDAQAANAYHASEQTVRNIKKVFVLEGLDAALSRKRRCRPGNVKIDAEAEAKIMAMVCSSPPEGYERWTLRLIAEKSIERGYVKSISHVAIGDLMKRQGSKRVSQ